MLSPFSQTVIDPQVTVDLALGLIDVHSATAKWTVTIIIHYLEYVFWMQSIYRYSTLVMKKKSLKYAIFMYKFSSF